MGSTQNLKRKKGLIRRRILKWYHQNKRKFPWRKSKQSRYSILVTEILLQKTKAENVLKVHKKFFNRYPTLSSLSKAKTSELSALLKPVGLYRTRARNLIKMAKLVRDNGFPKKEEDLLKLPGVGRYISNTYLTVRYNLKKPAVDVNIARLISRIFSLKIHPDLRRDKKVWVFMDELVPRKEFKHFNWALLDFANKVCKAKKPLCGECVIKEQCDHPKK